MQTYNANTIDEFLLDFYEFSEGTYILIWDNIPIDIEARDPFPDVFCDWLVFYEWLVKNETSSKKVRFGSAIFMGTIACEIQVDLLQMKTTWGAIGDSLPKSKHTILVKRTEVQDALRKLCLHVESTLADGGVIYPELSYLLLMDKKQRGL